MLLSPQLPPAPPGRAINAILAAVGYNFRRLNRWLRLLSFQIVGQLANFRSALAEIQVLGGRLAHQFQIEQQHYHSFVGLLGTTEARRNWLFMQIKCGGRKNPQSNKAISLS